MTEHPADLEGQLRSSLRRYADRPELHWQPSAVVADVVNRQRPSPWARSWLLSASAAVVVLLSVGVGLWAFRPSLQGSYAAAVSVAGSEYYVGVGRGLRVSETDLAPFGMVEQRPNGMDLDQFADRIAYTLDGVDPREALVARTAPGLSDDSGPYGQWFILWDPAGLRGPHSAALCGYFDLSHPAMREIECAPTAAPTADAPASPRPSSPQPSSPTTPEPSATVGFEPGAPIAGVVEVSSRSIRAPISATVRSSGIWTGSELIVWGGWLGSEGQGFGLGRASGDGAAYDPAADSWRRLSAAPIESRAGHFAIWTGEEMLIWGGYVDNGLAADGAAYNPSRDSWRRVPEAPAEWMDGLLELGDLDGEYFASAWTGQEWVIAFKGPGGETWEAIRPVAYDPQLDTWRELPTARGSRSGGIDLAWTGSELLLVSYDLVWRLPNDEQAWQPVQGTPWGLPVTAPAWAGDELLAVVTWWSQDADGWSFLASWDASSNTWQALPQPPASAGGQLLWDGRRVVVLGSDLAYDTVAGEWLGVPMAVDRSDAATVWTGSNLLIWGGWECGGCPSGVFEEGLMLTPAW